MEFHEKLQLLRKKQNLTQEQLAERLFVSRTAVSKWESGRGYPNLESLKGISRLFSVSIDELLSNDALIELAEQENRTKLSQISGSVFGTLDLITPVFLFLPLFGQREGEYVQAVSLLSHTGMSPFLRLLSISILLAISVLGVLELGIGVRSPNRGGRLCKNCSITLYAAAILWFALLRQPYVTVFLFLLFVVKSLLLIQENRLSHP